MQNNWTRRNKLQWNSHIFIQENAFENVVCEMAQICLGLDVIYQNDLGTKRMLNLGGTCHMIHLNFNNF